MHATPAPWIGYVIFAVVLLVLGLRLRTMRRVRRLRLETLWIVPAVLLAVLAMLIAERPPATAAGQAGLALALAAGLGIGWWRGQLMTIRIDPATHALGQQASPAALLLVILLLVLRQGLRYEAAAHGFDLLLVTDLLAAFAAGLVTATRAEMFVRARALLAAARGQDAPGSATGPTSSR